MNEGGWEDNITTSNILKLHYPKKKKKKGKEFILKC